jgi:hypothetical protein
MAIHKLVMDKGKYLHTSAINVWFVEEGGMIVGAFKSFE